MAYRQREGQADSPAVRQEIIDPVEDIFEGYVFPYRGMEDHGVKPPVDSVVTTEDDIPDVVDYPPQDPEPDPIAVRIVAKEGYEYRTHRVGSGSVGFAPQMIVNRNKERVRLLIRVRPATPANVLYLSDQQNLAGPSTGYPLTSDDDPLEIITTGEMYASTANSDDPTAQVGYAIVEEYTVRT